MKRRRGDEARVAADIQGLVATLRPRPRETTRLGPDPVAGVVVRGSKSILAGREEFSHQAGQRRLAGFSKPTFNCFFIPPPERPFLSAAPETDPRLPAGLTLEIPPGNDARASGRIFWAGDAGLVMPDRLRRLTELLDGRADIPVPAPLVVREIHRGPLAGKMAGLLKNRRFDRTGTARMARAVSGLKENYQEPPGVPRLAAEASAAGPTFHSRFKRATSASPPRFQKEPRPREARKIMIADGVDEASRAVGRESAGQFVREHKRQFGEPPRQGARKIRPVNLDKMSKFSKTA
ncbi:MAG: AraC family transcriptional regulator [Deltaproteobacteria bacterium]|nr:AraC family transcriptional regulator [Deltaproteobacteria bacterium]